MLIFGGRFQPFHIGHLAVINSLCESRPENVVLGIIAPDPEKHFPGDEKHWVRFNPENNPLSYWFRLEVIQQSLGDCATRIAAIVPLPRPSVNRLSANNYLPRQPRTFVLCKKWGDEVEQWKADRYVQNGEQLHLIDFNTLPPLAQLASGDLIRSLMRLENPAWKLFISPKAVTLFEDRYIWAKMTENLTLEKAKTVLGEFLTNHKMGHALQTILANNDKANGDITALERPTVENGLEILELLVRRTETIRNQNVRINQTIYMNDQYNAKQVIGGIGKNISIKGINVHQVAQEIMAEGKLSEELQQLKDVLKCRATTSTHDISVGAIAQAQECAKSGDWGNMVKYLREAGTWVLDVAKDTGKDIAAEAIRKSLGL